MKLLNFNIISFLILFNTLFISKLKSEDNKVGDLDSNSKNSKIFKKYSKPHTPKEFYEFFSFYTYYSNEKKEYLVFYPSEVKLLFNVELYYNKRSNKLHHRIYRVNYNEFNYKNEILDRLNKTWDACEESIENEIKNWEVNYSEFFIISGYFLIIEFGYDTEAPILEYKYIFLH